MFATCGGLTVEWLSLVHSFQGKSHTAHVQQYIHTYVHNACMYICTCVYVHNACTYVHMYICMD